MAGEGISFRRAHEGEKPQSSVISYPPSKAVEFFFATILYVQDPNFFFPNSLGESVGKKKERENFFLQPSSFLDTSLRKRLLGEPLEDWSQGKFFTPPHPPFFEKPLIARTVALLGFPAEFSFDMVFFFCRERHFPLLLFLSQALESIPGAAGFLHFFLTFASGLTPSLFRLSDIHGERSL